MVEYAYEARPTVYNGIQMRSRLEARYAASLDALMVPMGWTWKYEPKAFASGAIQYLPDFMVIRTSNSETLYVEVKPTTEHVIDLIDSGRMEVVLASEPTAVLMIVTPMGDTFTHWVFQTCSQGPYWSRATGTRVVEVIDVRKDTY